MTKKLITFIENVQREVVFNQSILKSFEYSKKIIFFISEIVLKIMYEKSGNH